MEDLEDEKDIKVEYKPRVEAVNKKEKEIKDKRNLYLLRASFIRQGTAQAKGMSSQDAELRKRLAAAAKVKLADLRMFVSPTRLAVKNSYL